MTDINTQVKNSLTNLMSEFDAITHNIANVSTVGYKRRFSDIAKELMQNQGLVDAEDSDIFGAATFDFSQGSLKETGSKLDLALYGEGFFKIETPEGAYYTRNGMFHLNQNGQLVDSQGRMVSAESGTIVVPSTSNLSNIHVASDGTISDGETTIGQIKIVSFGDKMNELIPVGMNCFSCPDDVDELKPESAVVKQGYLESSNVQVVDELVDMIAVSRLYQANMKFITTKSDNGKNIMNVAMG